eukprot:scaffold4247_cov60-Phaeocystis_antarctica.AAC.2
MHASCTRRASRVGEVVGDQHACAVGELGVGSLRRLLLVEVEEVVGLHDVCADAALLDPQDVGEGDLAAQGGAHHRVEAAVRALVGEDDEGGAGARQPAVQHVLEEVLEGGGEVRAGASVEVVRPLAVGPAVGRVEGDLEVVVLVDVDEQQLLRRRGAVARDRQRREHRREGLCRRHIEKLAVGLAVVPLVLLGERPSGGALHLAVAVPRHDDRQARDRALVVLAVADGPLPRAVGVLSVSVRHVEALEEEEDGHLLEEVHGVMVHNEHDVLVAHRVDAHLDVGIAAREGVPAQAGLRGRQESRGAQHRNRPLELACDVLSQALQVRSVEHRVFGAWSAGHPGERLPARTKDARGRNSRGR